MATKIKQQKAKNEVPMDDMKKLIIIIVCVIAVFLIFFIITNLVQNKKDNTKDDATTIQYSEILLSKLLYQKPTDYYVLVKYKNDENQVLYNTYLTKYKDVTNALNVFVAYIDEIFNEAYISETSNLVSGPANAIKFKTTTLVKISNNQAVQYFEGKDSIVNHLSEISK